MRRAAGLLARAGDKRGCEARPWTPGGEESNGQCFLSNHRHTPAPGLI